MAKKHGLEVVAEGIESQEQPEFLRQNGCEYGQGFLPGRPAPPEQFIEWARDTQ